MTQRDKVPGALGRLNTGNTRGGEHVTFMVAAFNNHRQGFRLHGNKRFSARFADGFRLGGDIHHVGFTRCVNMGQLRHRLFLQMRVEVTRTGTGIQLRGNNVIPRGTAGLGGTRHRKNQRAVGHPGDGA